jgi:hypothetical protein
LRWMAILKRSAAIPPDGTYVTKEPLLSPCLTPPPCLTTSSATRPRASCPHCSRPRQSRKQRKIHLDSLDSNRRNAQPACSWL